MATAELCGRGHIVASDNPHCFQCEIREAFEAQKSYRERDFKAFEEGWRAAVNRSKSQ